MKIALEITPNLEPLFGTRDENLRLMEDTLGVRIDLRSDAVHVHGPDEGTARVRSIFQDFEVLRRQGINPHNGELNGMLRLVVADAATTLRTVAEAGKQRSAGIKRTVQPRSLNQSRYVEAIEQMKMFLTRMGNNSKAVITGDITQIDLPNPRKSGLLDAINILGGVEGVSFCHFEEGDVVRHPLVQRIVRAYESAKPQQQELPLDSSIAVGAAEREDRQDGQAKQTSKPQ